jgi:probable addiction module antidote protein
VDLGRDAAFNAQALGDLARAKGMTQVAREIGLSRESLYNALLGDRSPSFDTILKVISALGLKLSESVKEGAIVEDVAEVA